METFFLANTRAYFTDLRSQTPFLSPWYLRVGKRSFLRGASGSLLKRRKNGISLKSMPRSILKLKSEVAGYLPNLVYCGCVFQHMSLDMNGIFLKYHLIMDGEDFKISILCLIQRQHFEIVDF